MISERAQRMVEEAPSYYQDAATYLQIQNAKAQEYDLLQEKIDDLRLQLNPATATWGLKYYEKELGIYTDESKPIEDRRSNVISKRRGFGNLSAELIQSVARSFTNGEVTVKNFLKNNIDLLTTGISNHIIMPDGVLTGSSGLTYTRNETYLEVTTDKDDCGLLFDYIPIGEKLPISFAVNPAAANQVKHLSLTFYDKDKNYLNRYLTSSVDKLENNIPPAGTAFVRANIRFVLTSNLRVSPQLEIGAASTAFEPRKSYELEIRFISSTGLPPNLDDFKAAIENIIHAHLGVTYRYRYITVTEAQAMTINQLNSTQLTNFAPFADIYS